MYLRTLEVTNLSHEPAFFSLLDEIASHLNRREAPAYIVGGLVRDVLLGRPTADIDIAVPGDALVIAREIAAAAGGHYVELDERFRIGRVVLQRDGSVWNVDLSMLRGTIEEDLAQRDFTIDAMALPLAAWSDTSQLIDPLDGRADLEARVIRAASDRVFHDDPARLLRAVRLAAELGFSIESGTAGLIRRDAGLVSRVAGERNREELLRILSASQAGRYVARLDELGILTALVPELASAKGVEQPVVHYWDVFEHSIQTVDAAAFLLRENGYEFAIDDVLTAVPWSENIRERFKEQIGHGSARSALLKLAALLHDIAKPQTKFVDETGRTRFFGHNLQGATIATEILSRLRFSAREIRHVEILIQNHLRPQQMADDGMPSRRAIYRFFRDTGDAGIDVLFLSLADHLAARGPTLDLAEWKRHAALVGYVIEQREAEETFPASARLVDGHEVMKIFGIQPGPFLGKVLEAVREAQAACEINTHEQALEYIRRFLRDASST